MHTERPSVAVSHVEESEKTVHPEVVAGALRELSRQEIQEPVDPVFEAAVEKGVAVALENIRARFEQAEKPNDNLEFHNTKHTADVIRRTRSILDAMGASQRHMRLGKLMAAYHDTVQAYIEDKKENGVVMRKRDIGGNETASAKELFDYMNANPDAFTQEERSIVTSGIQNTVPDWDPVNKTVIQPNLVKQIEGALDLQFNANSPQLVERAIALADIGTAGIDGPSKYLPEGDALFREEQLDIAERLKDPAQREDMKKRMLGWSNVQIDFAQGRKARLDSELKGLPEEMANNVRKLFSRFDDSIQAARLQYSVREKMIPEELAESFGYKPPKYTIH